MLQYIILNKLICGIAMKRGTQSGRTGLLPCNSGQGQSVRSKTLTNAPAASKLRTIQESPRGSKAGQSRRSRIPTPCKVKQGATALKYTPPPRKYTSILEVRGDKHYVSSQPLFQNSYLDDSSVRGSYGVPTGKTRRGNDYGACSGKQLPNVRLSNEFSCDARYNVTGLFATNHQWPELVAITEKLNQRKQRAPSAEEILLREEALSYAKERQYSSSSLEGRVSADGSPYSSSRGEEPHSENLPSIVHPRILRVQAKLDDGLLTPLQDTQFNLTDKQHAVMDAHVTVEQHLDFTFRILQSNKQNGKTKDNAQILQYLQNCTKDGLYLIKLDSPTPDTQTPVLFVIPYGPGATLDIHLSSQFTPEDLQDLQSFSSHYIRHLNTLLGPLNVHGGNKDDACIKQILDSGFLILGYDLDHKKFDSLRGNIDMISQSVVHEVDLNTSPENAQKVLVHQGYDKGLALLLPQILLPAYHRPGGDKPIGDGRFIPLSLYFLYKYCSCIFGLMTDVMLSRLFILCNVSMPLQATTEQGGGTYEYLTSQCISPEKYSVVCYGWTQWSDRYIALHKAVSSKGNLAAIKGFFDKTQQHLASSAPEQLTDHSEVETGCIMAQEPGVQEGDSKESVVVPSESGGLCTTPGDIMLPNGTGAELPPASTGSDQYGAATGGELDLGCSEPIQYNNGILFSRSNGT